jgi:predicted alpha/beta-fold hydrolase
MTAVEFLEEKFTNSNANFINWAEEYFEQAKEMEKQQIIDARVTAPLLPYTDKQSYVKEAEQYYNETFNK